MDRERHQRDQDPARQPGRLHRLPGDRLGEGNHCRNGRKALGRRLRSTGQGLSASTPPEPSTRATRSPVARRASPLAPNGQIAYSDPTANPQEIGRLTAGGTPQITPSPLEGSVRRCLRHRSGAYWFADFAANDLGRLTTDGAYTSLTGFSAAAGPRRVAAGPGNTLWVTLDTADKIARVTGVDPPPSSSIPIPILRPARRRRWPSTSSPARRSRPSRTRRRSSSSSARRRRERSSSAPFEKKKKKGNGGKGGPKRLKGDFRACTSPAKYKLKPGRYTFSVRASANDLTGNAESAKFKVVKKKE